MLALVAITPWHWVIFLVCILIFLALDLGVFHRKVHVVRTREALVWTGIWFSVALMFALALRSLRGPKESLQFLTGYLIELSLSMDNVFVIALIFAYFRIPAEFQHRVLYWGILGALVMRGAMIGAGVVLISLLSWILYVFGAFLVFSGIRMLVSLNSGGSRKESGDHFGQEILPGHPGIGWTEVCHNDRRKTGTDASCSSAVDGRNDRLNFCCRFDSGNLRCD